MSNAYVYRLATTYPPGSQEPGWQPPGWKPEPGIAPTRRLPWGRRKRAASFTWPSERLFLQRGSANHRADLLRKWGAEVTVERSLPVRWDDGVIS